MDDEDEVKKTRTSAKPVKRKQSRPMGEFGGNIGCAFWILFIPTCIYYFYGCVVLGKGALMVPNKDFWWRLCYDLPDGISIVPTTKAWIAFLLWISFQALLEITIPGEVKEGVLLKSGKALKYPMNGLTSFFVSNWVVILLCIFGVWKPYFAYTQIGALLSVGVIFSTLMALWLYIDFGILWKRHVNEEYFEEDQGVFSLSECFHDFFLGVVRNPRIKIFGRTLDLKRFWNARPGLTGWVLLNWSFMAAQYFGCSHSSTEITCSESGDWSRVSPSMWIICLTHWYYIFDYNWNEPAYLTTTDIRHDLFGWMLTYGDLGFLPWYYSISFALYLACLDQQLLDNYTQSAIAAAGFLFGMSMFRITNSQKDLFRLHYREHGNLDGYKIWGKQCEYIKTERGTVLLTSGYWGLARHFNYIGDMVMCVCWAIGCWRPGGQFPFVPLGYCAYFWLMDIHRCFRDEFRCQRKYKKDWVTYCDKVPYRIVPYIF